MSAENEAMSEREEIEMLLPWYVTGRLAADERAKVEAWLRREPDLAHQLRLAEDEKESALRVAEDLPLPAGLSVERTVSFVREQARPVSAGLLGRLSAALRDFIILPEGTFRLAAVAALAVIAVQGAMVATLIASREETYRVAGGPSAAVSGSFALVRFSDTASAKAITDLLASREMTIVDGPRPGGLFRVRIGAAGLTVPERDRRIATLRNESALVSLVLPSN